MEQTLGQRISKNRKRLGLTQDALAEQLGVTAQAVSKWENDLSCPDISMLPRLAEIFGISTDELLGVKAEESVHETEVVEEEKQDSNSKWEFHWDGGRKHGLASAICVLLVGALMLVSRMNGWDISFWSILWPSALLVYGTFHIFPNFSVFSLGVALLGGYFLVENLGIWEMGIQSNLFFPICVLLFGLSLLIDAFRKPKKPKVRIDKKGDISQKTRVKCENNGNSFTCDLSFGEATHLVSADVLEGGEVSVSFGELVVDLSDVSTVAPDCMITAQCHFGELVFLVPRQYRVENNRHTAFGSINTKGHPDEDPEATIGLDASVQFGEITIQYI